MKEKILVICDDDKTYIDRLGRYINSRKSRDLSVACFSDRDKLAEYAKENQVDLFLAGESWIDEKLCGDMRRWIELSENRTEEGHSYRCIYRYQPADEMLEKVLQTMKRPGGGGLGTAVSSALIGVYAPLGWAETTRLALAMAAHLGREGPAVYIGLNEFSPLTRIVGKSKGYDLSDAAYCWRRGKLSYEQLERMTSHLDGFDCVPAPVNPAELAELSGQELEELLEAVCSVGGYYHAVLDFGGSISGRHTLFEACGQDFVLLPDTETGRLSWEEFENFWETVGAGKLLKKTRCVFHSPEELKVNRRGKMEEYLNELAKQLLQGGGAADPAGGIAVYRGD